MFKAATPYKNFKTLDHYLSDDDYLLMYFNFIKFRDKYILVNDTGEFVFCTRDELVLLVNKQLTFENNKDLFNELLYKQFIYYKKDKDAIERKSIKYRTKKRFLFTGPVLHIFVVTTRCQHKCLYCQITPQNENAFEYDMSKETARKSVELMMESPSKYITVEFQGGETLLAFDKVKEVVLYTEELNVTYNKDIVFVIATSLVDITIEQLEFIKEHKIEVSTSLDGNEELHNKNRPIGSQNTYDKFQKGFELTKGIVNRGSISPLLTLSRFSLNSLEIIIQEYLKLDQRSISLRSLSPYGFAVKTFNKIGYTVDEYIDFYIKSLKYIIDLNLKGTYFREDYITLLLKRILTPYSTGYVDLQSPSGAGINALIYHYNGDIYPADEARMLAEMGDESFKLGSVHDSKLSDIYANKKLEILIQDSCAESMTNCSDCAFLPYCGADPLFNYVKQNDHYGHRPTSDFCKKQMSIFNYIFSLLEENNSDIMDVFWSWINRDASLNKKIKKEEEC